MELLPIRRLPQQVKSAGQFLYFLKEQIADRSEQSVSNKSLCFLLLPSELLNQLKNSLNKQNAQKMVNIG